MSKMKELSTVLDELVTCGETLINTANALKEIFSSEPDVAETPAPTEPAEEAKPAAKNRKKATATAPEPEAYTKEQVRGILAAKSGAGHSDEVRALLAKFGAKQLKQVDPKDYAALVKEAEQISESGVPVDE